VSRVDAAAAAVPPVFLWDPERGDLVVLPSAEDAARRSGPWQEPGAILAYDAEGRRIAFAVEVRTTRLLGLFARRREVVVVAGVEREPAHAEDLRRALVASLARRGAPRADLDVATLGELASRAVAALR